MKAKRCSSCKVVKFINQFGINRAAPDGLNYYCKPCISIKNKAEKRKNRARKSYEPVQTGRKICSRCNVFKSVREFYRNSRNRDGRSFECKECKKTYNAAEYAKRKQR